MEGLTIFRAAKQKEIALRNTRTVQVLYGASMTIITRRWQLQQQPKIGAELSRQDTKPSVLSSHIHSLTYDRPT